MDTGIKKRSERSTYPADHKPIGGDCRQNECRKITGLMAGNPMIDPIHSKMLYTYRSFSQIIDVSEKTVRNKVCSGSFPPPIQTIFGPRFSQEHIDFVLSGKHPVRRRGRPRIAKKDKMGKGEEP
ncbi:hypothetical protein HFU84_03850 [Acidithiobacillus sp. CV18-2]|nr:hypothetical protein [Acidithiobacillus sp. CV18-3]MBU2757978.1 hypothetical protein [Acidithiobacillus sp. BN09-2]MBU2776648.1 hypothetical protein [Acidithiobacillus sp. CV18-2]MBU2798661.1 hypothetical protein [Acidithiobacillus sp. VAN18-4]UTV82054.1 hypothetical protein MQE22_05375 [Acidithiobacillus sp. YTS05]